MQLYKQETWSCMGGIQVYAHIFDALFERNFIAVHPKRCFIDMRRGMSGTRTQDFDFVTV